MVLMVIMVCGLQMKWVQASGCNPFPCSVHSTSCTPVGNSYVCSCIAPYIGQNCTDTPCSPNPCLHNGTCTIVDSTFQCSCKYGYYGTTCANVTNFCSPDPCKNGGTCTSTPGVGYTCAGCNTGYGGRNCTTCQQYFECVNAQGQSVDTNVNCQHFCVFNPCLQPQYAIDCDSGTCIPDKIIPFSNPPTFNYTCDCDYLYTGVNCSYCVPGANFTADGCNCEFPPTPTPIVIHVGNDDVVTGWIIFGSILGGIIFIALILVLVLVVGPQLQQQLLGSNGKNNAKRSNDIELSDTRSAKYHSVSTREPESEY